MGWVFPNSGSSIQDFGCGFFLHLAILGMIHSVDAGGFLGGTLVCCRRQGRLLSMRAVLGFSLLCFWVFFLELGLEVRGGREEDGDEGGEWHDGVTGICSLGVTGE